MKNKVTITGFSLPTTIYRELEKMSKDKHMTRSEFMRKIIDVYFQEVKRQTSETHHEDSLTIGETDLARVLRSYWMLRSQSKLKIIIIGLALIINNDNKILIGARVEKDKWVENLSYVFPGGKLESLDFEKEIAREVKEETGIDIKVHSLITSRIHPDSGFNDVQIVCLYFYCSPIGNMKAKDTAELKNLKWVAPLDVFKYFTTSTCDEVTRFLATIQKSK